MDMTLYQLLPLTALLMFLVFAAFLLVRPVFVLPWQVPALASAAFAAWSLHVVALEGPLGFWTEHVRNGWGNQIWFDLLLAIAAALALLVPRARQVGMAIAPWMLFILLTGCIGLLAMFARCRFLEIRQTVHISTHRRSRS